MYWLQTWYIYSLCQKTFADKSISFDDIIKNFDVPKTKQIFLSFLARHFGLNLYIYKKKGNLTIKATMTTKNFLSPVTMRLTIKISITLSIIWSKLLHLAKPFVVTKMLLQTMMLLQTLGLPQTFLEVRPDHATLSHPNTFPDQIDTMAEILENHDNDTEDKFPPKLCKYTTNLISYFT